MGVEGGVEGGVGVHTFIGEGDRRVVSFLLRVVVTRIPKSQL